MLEGISLGNWVGLEDGGGVGSVFGALVGLGDDGAVEGVAEGSEDGDWLVAVVGATVGGGVGKVTGAPVGGTEELTVGRNEGPSLGTSEG